jgi:tetratricopeptide (TPR) repeat protein
MAARDRPHRRTTCSRHFLLLCGVLALDPAAAARSVAPADTQGTATGPRPEAPPHARRPVSTGDGREALQKAAVLVQEGRLEDADRQAQIALADPDTRAVAYSILGGIRVQQKRWAAGVSLLRKAIELEPRLVGARLTLAQIYTIQGKGPLAAELYRRVLALDPSNAAARQALARSEIEKGNCEGALALARPVLDVFKASPEGLSMLAVCSLKSGDRSAVSDLASRWTRLRDVPQPATIQFAQLLSQGGALAEAIEVLEGAKAGSPPSYDLAFALGGAYVLQSDPARALEAYDLALTLQPQSIQALRQAAIVAERNNELERALSYWVRAKKGEPANPDILLGFGRVCLKMDLLDDAEPALSEAARLKPGDPAAQYTLAVAKVGKRQYEAAQSLFEPLVAKQPEDPQIQYALGTVLYAQGRLDEAMARLNESVRLLPDQLGSPYYLALVARDQGRDADAMQMLDAVLQRHPDHAPSHEVLGGLLMNAQRYDEAEEHLRAAVRLNPRAVKANYQLGLLLTRMGKKEEAARQLELTKSLREEDEKTSRVQLRLMDPEP